MEASTGDNEIANKEVGKRYCSSFTFAELRIFDRFRSVTVLRAFYMPAESVATCLGCLRKQAQPHARKEFYHI